MRKPERRWKTIFKWVLKKKIGGVLMIFTDF